jgi:hypothetical protein
VRIVEPRESSERSVDGMRYEYWIRVGRDREEKRYGTFLNSQLGSGDLLLLGSPALGVGGGLLFLFLLGAR